MEPVAKGNNNTSVGKQKNLGKRVKVCVVEKLTMVFNNFAALILSSAVESTTISHKMPNIMLWCSSNVL